MNRIIKALICVCSLALASVAQQSYVIDSCDDGDSRSVRGGWWYTYNDSTKGGNSYVTPVPYKFKMSGPGYGNKGYAAHMKGTAGDKLGWDYIGMGVNITEACGCPSAAPVDLKEYSKIQFKMKGSLSGGRLTLVLPYTENKCASGTDSPESMTEWADYEVALTSKLKPEWTLIVIDLRKDFRQPKWAKQTVLVPIETVLKNVKNINFHYSSHDGDSVDLWVDEIEFVK